MAGVMPPRSHLSPGGRQAIGVHDRHHPPFPPNETRTYCCTSHKHLDVAQSRPLIFEPVAYAVAVPIADRPTQEGRHVLRRRPRRLLAY
jgi:hypothetical protein